jgi:hypothetical protein
MNHRLRIVFAAVLILGFAAACGANKGAGGSSSSEIGVNSFLWRASLDTIDFMPLRSADPYGGVINTEWYVNPEIQSERFRLTIFILDTRLRADGVRVQVHRQTYDAARSTWIDAAPDPATALEIENAILTRARQLRIATLE